MRPAYMIADIVRHAGDDAEVVRDEDDGDTEMLLQAVEVAENARPAA